MRYQISKSFPDRYTTPATRATPNTIRMISMSTVLYLFGFPSVQFGSTIFFYKRIDSIEIEPAHSQIKYLIITSSSLVRHLQAYMCMQLTSHIPLLFQSQVSLL